MVEDEASYNSGGEEKRYSRALYSERGCDVTTSHPTTSITSTSLGTQASNISMMEDRRTDPTTRHTFPKEKAEELVAAGAEPVGSKKEPKGIGAAEEEARDKVVEDGIISLEFNSPNFVARVLL